MSGHEMPPRDEEIAICHVCGERFSAQQELLTHLQATHPNDLLPDPEGDTKGDIDGPDQDAQG